MKTLILAAIRCSLMFLVTASLFSVQPAQGYTVTLQQVGSNVVATGSGAINLTGLTLYQSNVDVEPGMGPRWASILTGAAGNADQYIGFSGPTSFGSGGGTFASSSSGRIAGIFGAVLLGERLYVPHGYSGGNTLSDSASYDGQTFASLGVTPGTYVWTWGTGLPNQNFTLIIGAAGVPDGGSTVSLLGCALLGLAALRRKLRC